MGANRLADDELHARQTHAVVGQERCLEGEIGITEVDHDLGLRTSEIPHLAALYMEAHLPVDRPARYRPPHTRPSPSAPLGTVVVAFPAPTTAGTPSSRAMIAA